MYTIEMCVIYSDTSDQFVFKDSDFEFTIDKCLQ